MPESDLTHTLNLLPGAIGAAAVLIGGLLLRAFATHWLSRWARSTQTRVDDVTIATLRWPSLVWIVQIAIIVGLHLVELPGAEVNSVVRRLMHALFVLSLTLGLMRLARELVRPDTSGGIAESSMAPSGLLRTFTTVAILIVGLLLMLSVLEINIVPLLGALGVGGLAAGLALQPTLTNLFAGFHIALSRQFRLGYRVRLATGEEGYIDDIAWRTTTLRTPANHLIIIPNSKFADAIVTNFNLPDSEVNITVRIAVAYDSDPRHVEAALTDEAKRTLTELPQLVSAFQPVVRLQSFGDSALDYIVILRVNDFDAQFTVWNEVHTRFFERLRREGIEIPFPTRSVYVRSGGQAKDNGDDGDSDPAATTPPAR